MNVLKDLPSRFAITFHSKFHRELRSAALAAIAIALATTTLASTVMLLVKAVDDVAPGTRVGWSWFSVGGSTQASAFSGVELAAAHRIQQRLVPEAWAIWISEPVTIEFRNVSYRTRATAIETGARDERGAAVAPFLASLDDRHDGVLLSHSLWRRLGSPADIVGSSVNIKGVSVSVLGVAAEGVRGLAMDAADEIWLPFAARHRVLFGRMPSDLVDEIPSYRMVVKVDQSVGLEALSAALVSIPARPESRFLGDISDRRFVALRGAFEDRQVQRALYESAATLVVIAGSLLALAILGGLMYLTARAAMKDKALAVRYAVGETREYFLRRQSVEVAGAALVIVLLSLAMTPVAFAMMARLPGIEVTRPEYRFDQALAMHALLFALLWSVAYIAGLATARSIGQPSRLCRTLASNASVPLPRASLVVPQIALAIATFAGLTLLHSRFESTRSTGSGLVVEGLYYASVEHPVGFVKPHEQALRETALFQSVAANGGPKLALTNALPGQGLQMSTFVPSVSDATRGTTMHLLLVSVSFFEVTGLRLVEGRSWLLEEKGVAVLSESAAKALFGDGPALDREIPAGVQGRVLRVVGIVEDTRYASPLESAIASIYSPIDESGIAGFVIIRSTSKVGGAEEAATAIRTALPGVRFGAHGDARALWEGHLKDILALMGVSAWLAMVMALASCLVSWSFVRLLIAVQARELAIRAALGLSPLGVASFLGSKMMRRVGLAALVALPLVLCGAWLSGLPGGGWWATVIAWGTGVVGAVILSLVAMLGPLSGLARQDLAQAIKVE